MIKSVFIFIFVERTLTSCNLRDFLNCLYKGRFIASTFTIDTNSPASMFEKCRWILCRTQVFEWVKVGRILEPGVFFLICTSPPPPVPNGGEADGRKLPHLQSHQYGGHFSESKPLLDFGKCFWILGRVLDPKTCFWILGSIFPSQKCFWILGSVLDSGTCFFPMRHGTSESFLACCPTYSNLHALYEMLVEELSWNPMETSKAVRSSESPHNLWSVFLLSTCICPDF